MTFTELQTAIIQALGRQPFAVSASSLGSSPNGATLFAEFLVNATLTLNGATAQSGSADQVIVAGTLAQDFLGLSDLRATAIFTIVAGNAEVLLHLSGTPGGWQLSDSIAGYTATIFDNFSYSNAVFTLDSQALDGLGDDFPNGAFGVPPNDPAVLATLKTGLSFAANIAWADGSNNITHFIGTQAFAVEGRIDFSDTRNIVPTAASVAPARMQLASLQPVQTLTLGALTLPQTVSLYSILSTSGQGQILPSTFVGMTAVATVTPSQPGVPSIPLLAAFYGGDLNLLFIESNLMSQPLTLDAVAALLGVNVASVTSAFDTLTNYGFPNLNDIALLEAELSVSVPNMTLMSVDATVGETAPWSVMGGLFTFHDLAVTFSVEMGTMALALSLTAEVDIAGASIDGQPATIAADADLSNLVFGCALLDDDRPIDVGGIVNNLVGGTISMPAITCTEFKATGDLTNNAYRLQATVTDDWVFNLGSVPLSLTSIGFDLSYDNGASGEIIGQFNIAGVQVYLMAAYEGGAGGWIFGGGTMSGQRISLNDLVNDALSLFGIPNLPASLPQVTLTDLQMNFWTATGDVGFSCAGSIFIVNTEVDIDVTLSSLHENGEGQSATVTFVGHLRVGESVFEVDFMTGTTTEIFAGWQGAPISLEDVAGWLGLSLPQIPDALDLTLTSLGFAYNFTQNEFVLTASSADTTFYQNAKAVFLFVEQNSAPVFAFNMAIDVAINLSNLPLIGCELQSLETIDIHDIQALIASGALTTTVVGQLNGLVNRYAAGFPVLPVAGVGAGLSLNVPFNFGGQTTPVQAPVVTPQTTGSTPMVTPQPDSTIWVNLQKSFGPVTFKRVGVLYQDEQLYFKLDASFSSGGLGLTLDGLAVSSPLDTFSPSFHLAGIGAAFVEGPLDLAGAFYNVPVDTATYPGGYEYDGGVTIMFEGFGFAAVGSYAKLGSFASLFVFCEVDIPLGGPPAFFITGFSGGIGYNSSLRLPGLNEIYQFPFVAGLSDPAILGGQSGKTPTPLDVLDVLERGQNPWVRQVPGEDWLAVGISFTTYELLNSRALLVAEFGQTFEFALIGLATMQLPKGLSPGSAEVFAYVELQLEASFIPSDGFLGLSATLSPNSFVLDKDCHPTGGFAFYVWWGGHHAGDFALSVGGYHPSFNIPSWYPQVPRVGITWRIDEDLTITGQAYCALTPALLMAGGKLSATYRAGDLKAWFTAQADFLMGWLPFHYEASIGVSVGASFKLGVGRLSHTFSAEIGATLNLWGPRTGGEVQVHWSVISFTVSFGDRKTSLPPPLDWSDFSTKLLPDLASVQTAAISDGLLAIDQSDPQHPVWIVRPGKFAFTANSVIPASALRVTNSSSSNLPADTGGISIRPMNQAGVASTITLEIDGGAGAIDLRDWSITSLTANMPVALWGALPVATSRSHSTLSQLLNAGAQSVAQAASLNDSPTVALPTGFKLEGPSPSRVSSVNTVTISDLGQEPVGNGQTIPLAPSSSSSATPPREDATMIATIMQTVNAAAVANNRTNIFGALESLYGGMGNSSALPANGALPNLARQAGGIYTNPPLAQ